MMETDYSQEFDEKHFPDIKKFQRHPINEIIPLTQEEKAAMAEFGNHQDESVTNDVPEFDLGSRILAAQRNSSAQKRKGPGDKSSLRDFAPMMADTPAIDKSVGMNKPQYQQVIYEIVHRDICRYYKGENNEGNTGRDGQIKAWGLLST